jgi:hypothetical protein
MNVDSVCPLFSRSIFPFLFLCTLRCFSLLIGGVGAYWSPDSEVCVIQVLECEFMLCECERGVLLYPQILDIMFGSASIRDEG